MVDTSVSLPHKLDPTQRELTGNRICLDFVNTVNKRKGTPEESLHTYVNLLAWGVHASLLTLDEAEAFLVQAEEHPTVAQQVHGEAIELRETLYRIFQAVIHDVKPYETDTTALQKMYVEALSRASLEPSADAFVWSWPAGDLKTPLWCLVHNAVELLRTGDRTRLKVCASPDACASLFYDTSKNNSRRWCSMASCGVPEKVRQRQQRKHQD